LIFDKAIRKVRNEVVVNSSLTFDNPLGWSGVGQMFTKSQTRAMKLSAVNACVEIISNSISKLPVFAMDSKTKEHISHPFTDLLKVRPNEAMTPFIFKKLIESQRLLWGNAYMLIMRDRNGRPVELLPLPPDYVRNIFDDNGKLWFIYTNPKTGERRKFESFEIIHPMAYSEDGINGISVLQRASEVIATSQAAQTYENKFYTQNARPVGVLKASSSIETPAKDKIREEWAKIHSGADNAFRIAVLDLGLEYQQISINNKDSQFIESKGISVEDISRFFTIPIYKLNAGKQSYSSNEQNDIEYIVNSLHPVSCQYEQDYTYKGLFISDIKKGLEVKVNIMGELRGDFATRGKWYSDMWLTGSFSVNDILAFEDLPKVPGGDVHMASLNYVPLEDFKELSKKRNGGGNG